MDKEKLEEIIDMANAQAIDKALRQDGFFDMAKHPTLKKISLVPIAQSPSIDVGWLEDYKYSYKASLTENVKEYPNYIFIWLQINKLDKRLDMFVPHIQRVYAKEKTENEH